MGHEVVGASSRSFRSLDRRAEDDTGRFGRSGPGSSLVRDLVQGVCSRFDKLKGHEFVARIAMTGKNRAARAP